MLYNITMTKKDRGTVGLGLATLSQFIGSNAIAFALALASVFVPSDKVLNIPLTRHSPKPFLKVKNYGSYGRVLRISFWLEPDAVPAVSWPS